MLGTLLQSILFLKKKNKHSHKTKKWLLYLVYA